MEENNKEFKKLSKRALKCKYVNSLVVMIIFLAILGTVFYFTRKMEIVKYIILVVGLLLIISSVIKPYFSYMFYKYSINDEFIEIIEGYFFRERTIVPIERLHQVKTDQGIIKRIFKVSDITVTTAGGDVFMTYLDTEEAEMLASKLGNRINEVAIRQREKKQAVEDVLVEQKEDNFGMEEKDV